MKGYQSKKERKKKNIKLIKRKLTGPKKKKQRVIVMEN